MAGASAAYDDDNSPLSDINVVPLVDVVLVILIVFMITVPSIVGSAPIKVDLPETVSAKMAERDELPLHLYIKPEQADGKTVYALYLEEQPYTEGKLRSLLAGFEGKEKPPTVLAADKTVPHGEVVKVFDMLGSMGIHKLQIDTKHVEKN